MSLEQLIKECKKQDIKAQGQLYKRYANTLFSVSLKYSRNHTEAQDNLQDAFLNIFEKMAQFEFKGSFEGWLKRITINTALQKYRKQKVFEIIDDKDIEDTEVEIEDDTIDLEFLLKSIQELPDRYRLVFNLYVMDGYAHKEISKLLRISEGTSKSNLARGRHILKTKIEEMQQPQGQKSL